MKILYIWKEIIMSNLSVNHLLGIKYLSLKDIQQIYRPKNVENRFCHVLSDVENTLFMAILSVVRQTFQRGPFWLVLHILYCFVFVGHVVGHTF